jgi:hypothetical protein
VKCVCARCDGILYRLVYAHLCAGVIDAVEEDLLSRVFVMSDSLDSEAIVEFFHAMTAVSLEELSGRPTPRVYALSKIVEACHHNMMRPRIVWTTLWKGTQVDMQPPGKSWQGLSAYFVDIGCHENLQVAMYAMDALRQVCCPAWISTLLSWNTADAHECGMIPTTSNDTIVCPLF